MIFRQFDTRTENPEVIIRHTADREFHDAKSVAVSEARPNLVKIFEYRSRREIHYFEALKL